MEVKNDFFIGWQKDIEPGLKNRLHWLVVALFILIAAISISIPYFHYRYDNGKFELTTISTLRGVLRMDPAPMLEYDLGLDRNGLPVHQSVLLVSPGKFGAVKTLEKQSEWLRLNGKQVEMNGHLIYAHGHTLLEIAAIHPLDSIASTGSSSPLIPLGKVTLTGEIADPKCLLGVMNPGEGKVHRDCAIRCLSGGITPVLHVHNGKGDHEYYLLVGNNNIPIRDLLIPYVADQVGLCGNLSKWGDWYILTPDLNTISRLNSYQLPPVSVCK
jgi:hypothetical protein